MGPWKIRVWGEMQSPKLQALVAQWTNCELQLTNVSRVVWDACMVRKPVRALLMRFTKPADALHKLLGGEQDGIRFFFRNHCKCPHQTTSASNKTFFA